MATLLIELAESGIPTGKFCRQRDSDGFFWSTAGTPAYEEYDDDNVADYGIAATEIGNTGLYVATDPTPSVDGSFVFLSAAGADLTEQDFTDGVRGRGQAGPRATTSDQIQQGVADIEIEDGVTLVEVLQRIGAATAGKSSVIGNTVIFIGLDGITERLRSVTDKKGQRTNVEYDHP